LTGVHFDRKSLYGIKPRRAAETPYDFETEDEGLRPISDGVNILRAKWLLDGAATLADAARLLRVEADRLEALAAEGWTLEAPVADDYGFLRRPSVPSPSPRPSR
jgi:hypothetical protein